MSMFKMCGTIEKKVLNNAKKLENLQERFKVFMNVNTIPKKYYKFITVICMLLITFIMFGINSYAAEINLIKNPTFTQIGDNDLPSNWYSESYISVHKDSFGVGTDGGKSDNNYAYIDISKNNDARLVQNVDVKPNTNYKLSAFIKTKGIRIFDQNDPENNGATRRIGANIGVMDIFSVSRDLTGDNDWTLIEMYGETGNQKSIKVSLRIGHFGADNYGYAAFDDVSLTEVSTVPNNVEVVNWSNEISGNTSNSTPNAPDNFSIIFISILFLVFSGFLIKKLTAFKELNQTKSYIGIIVILVIAFIIRLISALSFKGFDADISCFTSWGNTMATVGPFEFYKQVSFCDYPPLYMVVLGIFASIGKLFNANISDMSYIAFIKMPAIICDLIMGAFIYKISKNHFLQKTALILSSLYLLNPAIIVNSSSWGQVDSVFTLAIVLSIYFIVKRKLYISMPIFLLGLLAKPQTIIFTPIIIIAVVYEILNIIKEKKLNIEYKDRIKKNLISFLSCVVAFFAFSVIFSINKVGFFGSLTWLINNYFSTITSYPYADLSAFNFFGLIGGQWAKDTLPIFIGVDWLTWKLVGNISIFLIVCSTIYMFYKSKVKDYSYFILGAFIAVGICTIGSGIHERYLFPALALILVSYIYFREKSLLYLFVSLSALHYFNVASVLFLHNKPETYFTSKDSIFILGCLAMVALFIVFVVTIYKILTKDIIVIEKPKVETKNNISNKNNEKSKNSNKINISKFTFRINKIIQTAQESLRKESKLNVKDYIIMLTITAIYFAFSLFNLGDMKCPKTFWEPREKGSYVIADFGQEKPLEKLYYFGSIGEGTFDISISNDNTAFTKIKTVKFNTGDLYSWKKVSFSGNNYSARYLKVESIVPEFKLLEIGCYSSANATSTIPIVSVDGKDNEKVKEHYYSNIFDEQGLVPLLSSYKNGMYFDEIYHARTAFEFLNDLPIYETTHPPLGKEIIAIGIAIFGMNPFGWRIMGMLMGVFMLPAMFVLGKKLFKSTKWAIGLTLLMALDGMHFAQTRISTIDSFVVLFIILMYLFMYMYISSNFYKKPFWKTLVPLSLSGICFGLAMSSKWTGLYGAVGLAFLLFFFLYNKYKEYIEAKKIIGTIKSPEQQEEKQQLSYIIKTYKRNLYYTLGFCVLFFVVMPFVIYALSYIPFYKLKAMDGNWMRVLLDCQKNMFDYHTNLTNDNHPFKSAWFEWPLIVKPIWYYIAPETVNANNVESISSFGNPIIWWSGFVSFFVGGYILIKDYIKYTKNRFAENAAKMKSELMILVFLFVGVASNYMPWVLVSRSTFIYHYFSTLPFVMGITIFALKRLLEKLSGKKAMIIYISFFAVCLIIFIAFYPLWSGYPILKEFAKTWLKWFSNWSIGV